MHFEPYPFEKLNKLLENITPAKLARKLTIGEPQFPTPKPIEQALIDFASELRYYPASRGEDYLKDSILGFIKHRFGITLKAKEMLPTFGTREVLFNFPQWLFSSINAPVLAHPNPFYQIYEGAARASGVKSIYMNLTPELVYEDGKTILAIRNPVMEKVKIINDTVQTKRGEYHGIGLLNVKAVVNKYAGEMVLTCDDNAFHAVVIL